MDSFGTNALSEISEIHCPSFNQISRETAFSLPYFLVKGKAIGTCRTVLHKAPETGAYTRDFKVIDNKMYINYFPTSFSISDKSFPDKQKAKHDALSGAWTLVRHSFSL